MHIDSAVVLAGGEGERLRPLTRNRPKPMLSAGTRPILSHVLDALVDAGVEELHIVVGYNRTRVQNHFGPTYRDCPITYHTQEKQLGTGHALLQARDDIDKDFVVVNGDELVRSGVVDSVIDAHTMDTIGTLAVLESERVAEYGAVRLDGDRVVELAEDPRDDTYRFLNRGVYAFGPSIFETVDGTEQRNGERRLTDAIGKHIDTGNQIRGVRTDGAWQGVTYPWHLLAVTTQVLSQGWLPYSERRTGVYVDDSASVHEDATLVAPVVVSEDAVVDAQAVVGPYSAIGQNATIGAGAIVRRTLVESDVTLGANATAVDSVLAQGATLDVAVTLAGGSSDVHVGTAVHEDRTLGSVVADRAHVGGGATVKPGTLIGPNARIEAGSTVAENVAAGVEVRQ
ncbi:sugar phosphate nucleotidyltransferase [Natronomonas sp. EA1]|uniref:sugar phosphate nucleotidyltransferase n=1 Tax=Natronomonas sp. EA1 TaxID=3421655 RepID=UPI003EB9F64A